MLTFLRKSLFLRLVFAAALVGLAAPNRSAAQEPYPAVARVSFVSGPVTYSRGDDPDEWDDAIENIPVTIGDRIYSPEGGRVELQLSSGNFVRLAPRSYFSTLNLSDDIKQFYLGEGVATFKVRQLPSNEVIEIGTPNVSVTLDEPGDYRISVNENGDSRVSARRGRVTVAASGRQIAVENSEIRIYGIDSPRYEIVGLPGIDAFDRWVSDRDARFDRSYSNAYRYASDDIIGVEDLSDYGRWEQIPEYGYAWTPASVAVGWVPFSAGRWFWQDPWGWTWISNDRWGWATSHYGRWTQYRSRWYWVPVRPRTRVIYAPAVVEFVRVRDHVGWFPLHPRDRYVPWWDRRDRFDRNITYVNRNYVTIVNQNTFISTRPVNRYIVRDSVIVRDFRSARLANVDLPVPTRSSIRVISETGGRRGHRPPENILNRAAVVRTAPALPPPTFQEKLPRIQKDRGKPIEPSEAATLTTATARAERVRVRPAAEVTRGREFAARNPSAGGPAPQPITEARGKRLARQEAATTQPSPADQNVGVAGRPEPQKQEQDRDRERQARQLEQERRRQEQQKEQETKAQLNQEQAQRRQQELQERQAQKQRETEQRQQQKEQERQSQLQKQQQAQERRQEAQPPRASREQQRLEELERQQAQREEQRKAQALQQQEREQARRQQEQERKAQALQQQQEQARREQARQQQLQERQTREQQRQQDLERRQREQERQSQQQQRQQEQARREQERQQQLQERQAQQQQRQQDLERRQQQEQARREQARQQQLQERNAQIQQQRQEQIRAQQQRQQQAQAEREAQQAQRQQEQQERRQPRQQPRQPQQQPTLPGQS